MKTLLNPWLCLAAFVAVCGVTLAIILVAHYITSGMPVLVAAPLHLALCAIVLGGCGMVAVEEINGNV